jgi:hypothetical protein
MDRLIVWHRLVPASKSEPDDDAHAESWLRLVVDRLRALGGTPITALGSTLTFNFDQDSLEVVIDAALGLCAQAERESPAIKVCFGVAIGPLHQAKRLGGMLRGPAIDVAQLLSNRAQAGEIVLDATAEERLESIYLFGRQLTTGTGSPRGRTIDRVNPRRAACRPAIGLLGEPVLPPSIEIALGALVENARKADGIDRVLCRGFMGAGSDEWIDALERRYRPSLCLRLQPVPAGLEPLGSLRLAFAVLRENSPEIVDALDQEARDTVDAIANARPVDEREARRAVAEILRAGSTDRMRAWIIADPTPGIDAATLEIVAGLDGPDAPDHLFIGRLPPDARVPTALADSDPLEELPLPQLVASDGRIVAGAILGPHTADEVARRIAVLGGATPLGILEAARTLIAAGDLVWREGGFSWRVGPRGGVNALPVESLIGERIAGLEPIPASVLEAICAIPNAATSDLMTTVLLEDGISQSDIDRSIEQLGREALITRVSPWRATSSALRAVVSQRMPPARLGELYRFVARAMEKCFPPESLFAEATRGYFLAEGGRERDGARALLVAATAAADAGYGRAALRLAAAAVQFDSSAKTRRTATELSRRVAPPASSRSPRPEKSTGKTPTDGRLRDSVVRAISARDYENLDRALDTAIAEGHDRSVTDRLRAVAHVARGDLRGAIASVARASSRPGDVRSEAKNALAKAIVLLHAGEPDDAIRSALFTLARTREAKDATGESAALHVLASCFRALGRKSEADGIVEAGPA